MDHLIEGRTVLGFFLKEVASVGVGPLRPLVKKTCVMDNE
jgi:hypothetical protein